MMNGYGDWRKAKHLIDLRGWWVVPGRVQRLGLPKMFKIVAGLSFCLALLGCTNHERTEDYGLQAASIGFVPARIALLPCQTWPTTAAWESRPSIGLKSSEVQQFCEHLDRFVEDGFLNQPYMRANSRRFVLKALSDAGQLDKLQELSRLWARRPDEGCAPCRNAPTYYRSVVRERPTWVAWLAEVASKLKNADAMLLPFVTQAYERRYDDRGLQVAERGLGVALLLIDTANGELLWAGGRHTVLPHKRLTTGRLPEPLAYPDWALAEDRVLTAELWRDFPGRQIY